VRPEAERATARRLPPDQTPEGAWDHDLNLPGIVKTISILAVVAAAVFAVTAWMVRDYVADARRSDAPPSPFAGEAAKIPAGQPRLATDAVGEIVDLRREEAERLGGYAWVDRRTGVARIPIERAIEIMAAREGASPFAAAAPTTPGGGAGAAPDRAAPTGGQR
jgi:hypothetical protein